MGNVSFDILQPEMNFNRAYVRGFVLGSGCSAPSLSGEHLLFGYPPGGQVLDYLIHHNVFVATSNTYSLDRVFDPDNCFCTIGGFPSPTTTLLRLVGLTSVAGFWIQVVANFDPDESLRVELPQLSNYWQPRI